MSCEICSQDIKEKNKAVVDSWSQEKQTLIFWYWCGVTDHGKSGLSPYDTEFIAKFDKHCGLD